MKTNNAQHTPGPWVDGEPTQILGGEDSHHQVIVAEVYIKADKALCLAAPDLLAACKRAERTLSRTTLGGNEGNPESLITQVRTAIAKAQL